MTTPTVDIAGIDLGTTNSVIAIPGHFPEKGQIYGPVTIIFDEVERLIQASAICALEDGEIIVGEDAKSMAEEGYRVTRFWKKFMGTDETYSVGNEEWSPEKLSAAVLKKMVSIVEEQLGIKIRRAVITHPAYFDALAINSTRDAAKEAGLDADRTLQMEPVAAAMAYTYEDTSPNVKVLVYDLGGGTFDVTLVERSSGNMNPRAFGGDRELGGYNFDKKIATKILETLRDKGYALQFDADNPQRDARWTTILYYAEQVKHKLTDSKKADIRKNGIFKDDSSPPKNVQLAFSLTEPEFRKMIQSDIDKTIRETKTVLEKAGETAEDIDYLVLVGGSSRIPAVREQLQAALGLEPQFDEDVLDLSVAAGAAMMAATSGSSAGGVFLDHIPQEADDLTIAISGRIEASEEIADPANFTITVTGGSSEEVQTISGSDGGFYVEVELLEDNENEINVTICSPTGDEVYNETSTVTHNEDSSPPPPPPIPPLPKPISIDTIHGLDVIAAENVPLPYENTASFRTVAELTEINLDLYQEDIQLSTILLNDFEKPVPPRCQVDLTIKIDTDYSMTATAAVPSEGVTKTRDIQLTKPVIPSSAELEAEFKTLKTRYQTALENTPDGPTKARIAADADRVLEEIDELFADEHPERMQLFMLMKKLMLSTKELSSTGQLVPSKKVMDSKFDEARRLLPDAESKDSSFRDQDLSSTLDALQSRADKAAIDLDSATWRQVAGKMDEILAALNNIIKGGNGGGGGEELNPMMLKRILDQELKNSQEAFAAKKGTLSSTLATQIENQLTQAKNKLANVDISSPDAKQELYDIYSNHIQPAANMLGSDSKGDGVLERI